MQLDKPNVEFPLALSYNERGPDGYTKTVTNGIDQRKVNCFYEPVKNALTGKSTLILTKRPGVTDSTGTYGTSGQVPYLISLRPGVVTFGASWVFSTSGDDIRASDVSGTTTVVATAAGYAPSLVDRSFINSTETLVLQIRAADNVTKHYYATVIGTFTEITDVVFAALTVLGKMEFIDGYAFVLASDNYVHNCALNNLASWPASNKMAKQITMDFPRAQARLGKQLIAFGGETMEVFVNGGNATGSPLVSVPELHQRVGIAGINGAGQTHYYATIGRRMFFVGRLAGGENSTGIFVYDGARVEKISTGYIDKIITETNPKSVYPFAYYGQTAVAFALTLPTDSTQRWLMFFPEWNDWFEFNSTIYQPINNGRWFLGLGSNGHKVYNFAEGSSHIIPATRWLDAGTSYTMTVQFKMPRTGNHRKFMSMCGVVGDTARSASTLNVSFSDDDDQNFSSNRAIDMTQVGKKHLYRCGSYTDRTVRLTHAGDVECRLESFVAKVSE